MSNAMFSLVAFLSVSLLRGDRGHYDALKVDALKVTELLSAT